MTHHIDQHFDHCVLLHVPDDINQIIFCGMRSSVRQSPTVTRSLDIAP